MNINPSIFKEYDIRGIYPDEIDINVAYRIAAAFVKFLNAKQLFGAVVVGRDARLSSPELHEAFAQGIIDQGRDVFDIGIVSTPLFYFSVIESKASGGAMITASHNPKEYNGIKFVLEGALPLGFTDGIGAIRDFSMNEEGRKISQGKKVPHDFSEKYISFLLSRADIKRPVRFVIDASNGSAGEVARKLVSRLSVEYKALFLTADGNFPNHSPNPLDDKSIHSASKEVVETVSEFGVILDGDGDRIAFLNENGKRVRSDVVGAYLADHIIQNGESVVMTKNATKAFRETVEKKGGVAVFSRVGHSNVKKKMREINAVFGAEPSGHIYFRDFHYADSALLALVYLLSFLSVQEKKFSEVVGPYNTYFYSSELNFTVEDRLQTISRIKTAYQDGVQDGLDGLTVEYKDWWFNARASNTEPLLRLTIEAKTKEILNEKIKEITEKIKNSA